MRFDGWGKVAPREPRDENLHNQWCANCAESGHSARNCVNPAAPLVSRPGVLLEPPASPKPHKVIGGQWVLCRPAFPADHPARRNRLGW